MTVVPPARAGAPVAAARPGPGGTAGMSEASSASEAMPVDARSFGCWFDAARDAGLRASPGGATAESADPLARRGDLPDPGAAGLPADPVPWPGAVAAWVMPPAPTLAHGLADRLGLAQAGADGAPAAGAATPAMPAEPAVRASADGAADLSTTAATLAAAGLPGPGLIPTAEAWGQASADASPAGPPPAPGRPDFGEALARHAVHHARIAMQGDGLHQVSIQLHPVEMGPLSVAIEVRGEQARIEFGAAHAETRLHLEAALPRLSEALRAEGLVLAHGVVHAGACAQPSEGWGQPPRPRDPPPGPARARAEDDGDEPGDAQPPARRPMRIAGGRLDLYA